MPARVLVVDDTPLNVKLLTVKLEYEDYVVITAADGFEALAKIEAEKPDIVLLDVLMPPGIDGFETCRRIRADPATAHIPVVMVTALQDVDELVRGFEAGADDFLTIPVNSVVLMARIRSQLRQKRYYESLLEQSMIDPLTGAFNCRYLEAHVPRLIARCRAANKPIAVMMIDIDHFKRINDERGHAAGNHVLKEIANRLTSLGSGGAGGRRRIRRRDAGNRPRRGAPDRRTTVQPHRRHIGRGRRRHGQHRRGGGTPGRRAGLRAPAGRRRAL